MEDDCKHEEFLAKVSVLRQKESDKLDRIVGYSADIKINCSICGQAFEFIGTPCGYSPLQPTTSIDYTQLRAPIRPSKLPPIIDEKNIVN